MHYVYQPKRGESEVNWCVTLNECTLPFPAPVCNQFCEANDEACVLCGCCKFKMGTEERVSIEEIAVEGTPATKKMQFFAGCAAADFLL